MKFGRCVDPGQRIEAMRNGWPQDDHRHGPALALTDDWELIAAAKDVFDSEARLLCVFLNEYRLSSETMATITDEMRTAALPGLAGETNGVGELRCMPSSAGGLFHLFGDKPGFDPVIRTILYQAYVFISALDAHYVSPSTQAAECPRHHHTFRIGAAMAARSNR